jgi:hypothetical protein
MFGALERRLRHGEGVAELMGDAGADRARRGEAARPALPFGGIHFGHGGECRPVSPRPGQLTRARSQIPRRPRQFTRTRSRFLLRPGQLTRARSRFLLRPRQLTRARSRLLVHPGQLTRARSRFLLRPRQLTRTRSRLPGRSRQLTRSRSEAALRSCNLARTRKEADFPLVRRPGGLPLPRLLGGARRRWLVLRVLPARLAEVEEDEPGEPAA